MLRVFTQEKLEGWLDRGRGVRPSAAVAICLLVGIVMGLPTVLGAFLSGDDFKFAVNFRYLDELSLENAWRLLTMIHVDLYQPLPMLSFQLNHAMAAATPGGPAPISPLVFHITNILLHGLNVALVFLFASRLARDRRLGLLTALMFAVHPLAAEPVAWISGRMILLGTTFALATLCFCAYRRTNARGLWPLWAGLTWLCSLASKVMPTVPIAAAICDLHLRRRVNRRAFAFFAMLLLMSIVASGFAYWTTNRLGAFEASDAESSTSAVVKVLLAARAYLEHYVVPVKLAGWTPPPEGVSFFSMPVAVALIELVGFVLLAWWAWKKDRLVFVGLALFVVLLLPFFAATLGRRLLVADRYMYLPMVGLQLALAGGMMRLASSMAKLKLPVAPAVVAIGVVVLFWWATISLEQADYWKDSVARAERVCAVYPWSPAARANLGAAYLFNGQPDEAMRVSQSAGKEWADNGRLAAVAGEAAYELGRYEDAEQAFRLAAEKMPKHPRTLLYYGLTLKKRGLFGKAEGVFRQAVEVAPGYTPAVIALSRTLLDEGKLDDAAAVLRRRVSDEPEDREARHELAMQLLRRQKWEDARDQFARLVTDDPKDQRSMLHLAVAQSMLGQNDEALATYDRLLAADPTAQIAQVNRANILVKVGRFDAAEAAYREILSQAAGDAEARIGLHMLLQRLGRFDELPSLWNDVRPLEFSQAENDLWLAWSYALAGDDEAASRVVGGEASRSSDDSLNGLMKWAIAWPAILANDEKACLRQLGPFESQVPATSSEREFAHAVLAALTMLPEATRQSDLGYYVLARVLWLEGRVDAAMMASRQLYDRTQNAAWKERATELLAAMKSVETHPRTGTDVNEK